MAAREFFNKPPIQDLIFGGEVDLMSNSPEDTLNLIMALRLYQYYEDVDFWLAKASYFGFRQELDEFWFLNKRAIELQITNFTPNPAKTYNIYEAFKLVYNFNVITDYSEAYMDDEKFMYLLCTTREPREIFNGYERELFLVNTEQIPARLVKFLEYYIMYSPPEDVINFFNKFEGRVRFGRSFDMDDICEALVYSNLIELINKLDYCTHYSDPLIHNIEFYKLKTEIRKGNLFGILDRIPKSHPDSLDSMREALELISTAFKFTYTHEQLTEFFSFLFTKGYFDELYNDDMGIRKDEFFERFKPTLLNLYGPMSRSTTDRHALYRFRFLELKLPFPEVSFSTWFQLRFEYLAKFNSPEKLLSSNRADLQFLEWAQLALNEQANIDESFIGRTLIKNQMLIYLLQNERMDWFKINVLIFTLGDFSDKYLELIFKILDEGHIEHPSLEDLMVNNEAAWFYRRHLVLPESYQIYYRDTLITEYPNPGFGYATKIRPPMPPLPPGMSCIGANHPI